MSSPERKRAREQRKRQERDQRKRRRKPLTPAELDVTHEHETTGRRITGHDMQRALQHMDQQGPEGRAYVIKGLESGDPRLKRAAWRLVEGALEDLDRPQPPGESTNGHG